MEDWIAGTFAVLGTLMVLAGGSLLVLKAVGRVGALPDADTQPLDGALRSAPPSPAGSGSPATEPSAASGPVRRLAQWRPTLPTQLIGWGIVLLVLAAVTVGLIELTLSVGTPS
jgi:hypothetical protein